MKRHTTDQGKRVRIARIRADALLLASGLAESLATAQALIMAGRVWLDGKRIDKAGQAVAADAELVLADTGLPFASRGGVKLAGALDRFDVDVAGKICLDVGASTGGFTDCLLQRGAALVMALDVGKGQLDWTLSRDPRVIRLEGINARLLQRNDLPTSPQCVTVDVSFISLALVLPPVLGAVTAGDDHEQVDLIALVKPQFELPRDQVQSGGIVRDEASRKMALSRVEEVVRSLGWQVVATTESPLRGAGGNLELFMHGRKSRPGHQHIQ